MTLVRWISSAVVASLALTARSTAAGVPDGIDRSSEQPPAAAKTLSLASVGSHVPRASNRTRTLFTWTGRVDREVYLTMRGREVRIRGEDWRSVGRTRISTSLPRSRGDVSVHVSDGRGEVRIVEQPSARNGYTTTIRIRDPRGGADGYRLTVFWRGDDRYDDRWDNRRDDRRNNPRDSRRDDNRYKR